MKKNTPAPRTQIPLGNKQIWAALFVSLFTCCLLLAPEVSAQNSQTTWQKHLDYLKSDATKDQIGDLSQLKLLKYTYKGKINSEKDKSRVIEALYSDKAPAVLVSSNKVVSDTTITDTEITIHQKTYPEFEIVTVRQMVDAGKLSPDSIALIKRRLYENIEIGFICLKMDWIYKGKKIRSLCIVSDDGIPSDPITSGLRTGGNTMITGRNPENSKR